MRKATKNGTWRCCGSCRESGRELKRRAHLASSRFSPYLEGMEVSFTPELEAKLAQSAARLGRSPDDLVQEVVSRYFDEEGRFLEAVKRGEAALKRGEYLTHEQVGQRLERILRP